MSKGGFFLRKFAAAFLAVLLLAALAAMPFLCTHCSLTPERTTYYYKQKARKDAQADDSPEAQLMRMLLGGAAEEASEPESSAPAFSKYGLFLAIAAAVAVGGVFLVKLQKKEEKKDWFTLFAAAALAVPLGLFGARFVYCAANFKFYLLDVQAPEALPRVWEGGLSLSGALAFAVLGGVIAAKCRKVSVRQTLNGLTPGLLVFAGLARLSEGVIGAGYGPEAEALTVVIGDSWRLDTARIMAVAIFILLILRKDFIRSAFLYGSVMILLESLRRDGHMMWGFVHAEQVFALCIALPALLYCAAKIRRFFLALGATALMAGAVIGLEFALDRSPVSDALLYGAFALVMAAYIALGMVWAKKGTSGVCATPDPAPGR